MNMNRLARGLGWFSIGLGLAEVAATKKIAKAVNLEKKPGLVQSYGVREIATGVGILTRGGRSPWLWARVAGDVMDLLTVGSTLKGRSSKKGGIAAALAAVAGVTALDVMCSRGVGKLQKIH